MAANTSVTPRAPGAGAAAAKAGTPDLASLLSKKSLATKDDLAAVLKSGVSAGMLAVALLNRSPATKGATAEFVQALADQLKTESAGAKAGIDELQALAKGMAPPSGATAKAAVEKTEQKVDAAATPKTAPQRHRDQKKAADGQKALAKASKGLGFEVSEQPPKAAEQPAEAAPAAAATAEQLQAAVQAIWGQLQQADDVLQSMPPQLKRQAADAMNGYGVMPGAAVPYQQQAEALFSAIGQNIGALSTDDQRAVYQRFGINVDAANAAAANGGAQKPQQTLMNPAANSMTNAMGTKGNPAIGSRINPLEQTPLLPLQNQNGNGISAPDTRSKPPIDQLRALLIDRLGIAGGRYNYKDPTPLTPLNPDNPQENPDMARFHASLGPQQQAPKPQLPPLQPMPGGLEKMVAGFGASIGAPQMEQLLAAAKKAGVSADSIADQLLSNQGPFAQLAPRLGYGVNALMNALDTNDAGFAKRSQALANFVSAAAVSTPGVTSSGGLMSAGEMAELLKRSASPAELARQVLSGKSPLQGRLTGEAIGMLHGALDPKTPKTLAEAEEFVRLSDGLMTMQAQLPPGPGSIVSGAPYGLAGNVPFNGQAAMTGALATMGAGFIPTGNTGFDLANAIAQMPTYSPAEQAMLNQIQDPQQRAMQELQMYMQKQALLATTLSNLANMRHEMMKTVANNLRG